MIAFLKRDCASVACQDDSDQPSVLQSWHVPNVEMTITLQFFTERKQKPREKNMERRFEQPVIPFVRTQTAVESCVAKLCLSMSSQKMELKNPTVFMQL